MGYHKSDCGSRVSWYNIEVSHHCAPTGRALSNGRLFASPALAGVSAGMSYLDFVRSRLLYCGSLTIAQISSGTFFADNHVFAALIRVNSLIELDRH